MKKSMKLLKDCVKEMQAKATSMKEDILRGEVILCNTLDTSAYVGNA